MKRKELAVFTKALLGQYGRMTVRQIYYQLVSRAMIPNTLGAYKAFDALLTRCREDGLVNPSDIIEGSRPLENFTRYGFGSMEHYLEVCKKGYRRDPLEGQPYQVELWIEKDALRRFIVAGLDLPVPNLATRGYSPYTLLHEARLRGEATPLVVLQFGDHDPSGEDIFRDIQQKLPGAHHVERVALTREQVKQHSLPPLPAKASDSRFASFVARHGDEAVELDALPPDVLQGLARDAVEWWIDREQVEHIQELEAEEQVRLRAILEKAAKNL